MNKEELAKKIFEQWILGLTKQWYGPVPNVSLIVVECSANANIIYGNTGVFLHVLSNIPETPQLAEGDDEVTVLQKYTADWVPVDALIREIITGGELEKLATQWLQGNTK
jgi:hypothetical protein